MSIFRKILIVLVGLFSLIPSVVFANDGIYKGKITQKNEVSCGSFSQEEEYSCISYDIDINGKVVTSMPTWINNPDDLFKVGSKVYVSNGLDIDGNETWNIESYSKENYLLILFIIFISLILIITGIRGLRATFGLCISFLILYLFAIPKINTGSNIVLIGIISVFVLLLASTFITYGFNIKSIIAFTSTIFGVLIILALGYLVILAMDISGSGEESSAMLFDSTQGMVKLSSVYLFSIIVGALGVLDDVTIGQASSMIEIFKTDKTLKSFELFKKSMNIGKDHIASMVNTLFIAYAGSSFSLVMLLSLNNPEFRILINTGFVVEEIVRTLVASIGLILVVPLTSLLASKIIVKVVK